MSGDRSEGAARPRYRPGDRIGQRYLVYQALLGGMGEVYLCLDGETNLPYALKTCQAGLLASPDAQAAFRNEILTWIALERHPHIVCCFYTYVLDNRQFMFLEWVPGDEHRGTSLRSWLQSGPLDLQIALLFGIDACRGLSHGQERSPGLVHCDLKPENILITRDCVAKITDFGLARVAGVSDVAFPPAIDTSPPHQGLTRVGNVCGTPSYMAPEQWNGRPLDPRTDLYALGCILFEMLTGRRPFTGTLASLREQHVDGDVPALPADHPLARGMNDIIARCLAKEAAQRWSSPGQLLGELVAVYKRTFRKTPRTIQFSSELSATDYNLRGMTYNHLQRYEEARADFALALRLDPNYAAAYANRAATEQALGRHEAALSDLTRAISLEPENAGFYDHRGVVHRALERYADAQADFNKALSIDPARAAAHVNRGNLHFARKHYEAALADYGQALGLDPALARAYEMRARVHLHADQCETALEDAIRAVNASPGDALMYEVRGEVYHRMERYDAAARDLRTAVDLDPDLAEAHFWLGAVLWAQGSLEEALIPLQKAERLGRPLAAEGVAELQQVLQKRSQALSDRTLAILGDEAAPAPYCERARVYRALGRTDEALMDYQEAIHRDPNQAVFYEERGGLFGQLGRYREALDDFDQAVRLNPGQPSTLNNRGLTHRGQGSHEHALSDFNEALRLRPDYTLAYFNRACTLLELGRYEAAVADLTSAIRLDPADASAYLKRGLAYSDLGQTDAALADFGKALQIEPANALIPYNAGAVLAEAGRLDEAVTHLEQAARLGHPDAAYYAGEVRRMHVAAKSGTLDRQVQQVFQAIRAADSPAAMRQVAAAFPAAVDPLFIATLERTIAQAPRSAKPRLQRRLQWLREIREQSIPEVPRHTRLSAVFRTLLATVLRLIGRLRSPHAVAWARGTATPGNIDRVYGPDTSVDYDHLIDEALLSATGQEALFSNPRLLFHGGLLQRLAQRIAAATDAEHKRRLEALREVLIWFMQHLAR